VRLGIPERLAHAPLPRRLAWLTGARLLFLTALLTLMGEFYLGGQVTIGSFTVRVALVTLCSSFALAAVYATLLRSGRHLERLADTQLVLDQLTWTVAVYLSGGIASGATSLYGLTCLVGAILTGMRGAALAAAAGAAAYLGLTASLQWAWLVPPPDQPLHVYQLASEDVAYYALINLLVIVVVMLLAGYLAERLRLTGGQLVRAEERAQQAEHLAAFGRLAAGLAHEIRNPLGSIAGSIQLLRSSPALSLEERDLCEIVQREASRLNDLVTDMMDLSRPRKPEIRPVNVAAIAREVVELSSKSGRAVSDVAVRYHGLRRAVVNADEGQIRQLIWNLVRNAVQASSAGDCVDVSVTAASSCGRLLVTDTGIGIDDAAKGRIFDAFFTTRSHGTGVGLAVVKRIADGHGFRIDVRNNPQGGATFDVELGPVTDVEAEPADAVATSFNHLTPV
jgi:signal transduction histidine kinase